MCLGTKSPVYLRLLICCILFSAISGCGRETSHVGAYIAEIKDSTHCHETILELKETGIGVWRLCDDEANFSWYIKGNELRLLTRNGGTIVGSLDNEVIHVTLPGGTRELLFKKVN